MNLEYPVFEMESRKAYTRSWNHGQLKQQEFSEILGRSPSFKNCFNPKLNLTRAFKSDIERRTRGEIPLSVVIQIYGKQGDGKTKLGIEAAKKIDPKFSAKKIFMKTEPLLDYCKKAKTNDCLMLDEQALQYGEGSLRQLAELQNIEEITRILQLHLVYCSPTLREHMACHYTLKVIQKNVEKRITKFAFTNHRGSHYYGYGLSYIPKDKDCPIWTKYEPIKLKYVKAILERSSQKYDIWSNVKQLLAHKHIKHVQSKQDLMVLAQDLWPTLTIGEHKKITNAYFLQKRSKENLQNLIKIDQISPKMIKNHQKSSKFDENLIDIERIGGKK